MMMIALASILFVSCGGGGGGGGGGSSNLPINPSKPTPSRPVETDPAYKFPTTSNPLDSRKGDMSALKTSLYNDQLYSGASIPKDTRETDGLVAGINAGKLEGSGVKVAILDANFQDAVRTSVEDKNGKTVDEDGNALVPRRDRTLTTIYTDVDILAHPNKYSENAISGTERATSVEHGEEVLEVVRDIEYAPNHLATTYAGAIGGNNPRNKINVILGTVGLDYKSKRDNKEKIGAIIPKQETYDAALASFGNQSVKIFNQSFGSDESYEDPKYAAYENSGESPLYFFKSSAADTSKPMVPYFKDVVNNKGGLFIWSAGNTKNRASSLDAGLPYFDQSLEKGWISVVGVVAKKDNGYFTRYNVIDGLSHAGSDAAYWSISADERGMKKIVSVDAQGNANISTGIGSSYAAPRVTRAAALVYEKYDWMTNDQIRQTLFTTTDETDVSFKPGRRVSSSPDSEYGWGMLNQARALKGPGAFMNVSSNRSASKVFNANVPSGTTSYFDNDIFGDGGLRKLGDGTLHLTGNNSFSGGSTVTAGTLEIHQIHSSPITVGTNGTLVLNPKAIVGYDSWAWETIDTVSPEKITDTGIKVKNYGTVKFDGTTAIIGGDYVAYAGSDTQVGFKNSVKVLGKIRIQNGNVSVLSNDYVSQNEKATIMQGKTFEGNIAKVETNGMRTANVEVKDGKVVATMSRQNPVEYVGEEALASTKNVAENVENVFQDLDRKVKEGTATKEELAMGATIQNRSPPPRSRPMSRPASTPAPRRRAEGPPWPPTAPRRTPCPRTQACAVAAGWSVVADRIKLFAGALCALPERSPSGGGAQASRMRSEVSTEMSIQVVYAIVKAGGRQEKVSVGDVVVVDRLAGEIGDEVSLAPVMLVDGDKVTTAAADLAASSVTAEIVGEKKGPKINILKFKNKTGFRKRQGYRAKLTEIRITAIK